MTDRNREFIDYIDQEALHIESITINEASLTLIVRNLGVLAGHPRYPDMGFLERCTLVFDQVTRSVRQISEYLDGDMTSDGFKPVYTIDDGPFPQSAGPAHRYYLAGVLDDPCAWVDWEIDAGAYRIVRADETIPA
jgi:hypothetical protein